MTERKLPSWSIVVLAACAAGLGAYGAVVLTEWHTQSVILAEPSFLPFRMHYDSAWAFVFCSLSLFAFVAGSRLGAGLCATVVILIGCARWIQYVFPDIGLPTHPMLGNPALEPGDYDDISLLTAAGLIFVGVALLSLRWPPYSAVRSMVLALLGFATVALGLFLLIGSQSPAPLVYDWTQIDGNDAINAVAFLVLGGAVLFSTFFGREPEHLTARRWMPLAIWLVIVAVSFALWQAMRAEQTREIQNRTRFVSAAIDKELASNVRDRVRILQRVSFRWQSSRMQKDQWYSEMTRLLGDIPEYRALAWADPQLIVRWLVPGGSYATGVNLLDDPERSEAATLAQASRSPAVTGLIDLAPGQKGLHLYVPVYADGQFQGMLVGMIMRADWLESLLADRFTQYSITLRSHGDLIGELRSQDRPADSAWFHRQPVMLYNAAWTLEVAPTQTTLKAASSALPQAALLVGVLLATLLAFVVFFFQMAVRRIHDAASANRQLALDIEARKRTERALVESEHQNRVVVEEARDHYFRLFSDFPNLVWRGDASGKCDYCNQAWFDFTGGSLEQARGDGWLESLHPDDRPAWLEAFAQARQGRQPFEMQYRLRRNDGRYGWIICTCRPYHNMRGEFAGYLASCYDNTTRRQMESEIETSRERMRAFSRHLQTAREEEKARMARELHDELGATLTALRMDSSWLSRKLSTGEETVAKKSRSIVQLADSAIHVIRRIITELRPSILDNLGLIAALRWQAGEFQERAGVTVDVQAAREEGAVDRAQAIVFFRIFQEALTNIAKHAGASKVIVRFETTDTSHVLEVKDDGIGMSADALASRAGHGILGMQERAHELGGECVVTGAPGQGTIVRVTLPLVSGRAGLN